MTSTVRPTRSVPGARHGKLRAAGRRRPDVARVPLPNASEVLETLPGLAPPLDLASLNVIRAQANNPAVLGAVIEYVRSLYDQLPADVRQLTILAVAREERCEYEWHQHVPVARDVGVAGETVRAIGRDDLDAIDDRDRAVVGYARAQCRGDVVDAHVDALTEHITAGDVVAIARLAANYAGTADMISGLAVPLEDAFVGWAPE